MIEDEDVEHITLRSDHTHLELEPVSREDAERMVQAYRARHTQVTSYWHERARHANFMKKFWDVLLFIFVVVMLGGLAGLWVRMLG